jgi:AAA15 family ATPase/GTPase
MPNSSAFVSFVVTDEQYITSPAKSPSTTSPSSSSSSSPILSRVLTITGPRPEELLRAQMFGENILSNDLLNTLYYAKATRPFIIGALIWANNIDEERIAQAWNKIALTKFDDYVVEALKLFNPDIQRLSIIELKNETSARVTFKVKLASRDEPVAIGSLGNGVLRCLQLVTLLTQCEGGIILIDEIDTGLHYSVLCRMWKMIFSLAKELDVQIFATTHSYDCIASLAQFCSERPEDGETITLHRIDATKSKSVRYAEPQLISAAEYHTEVR